MPRDYYITLGAHRDDSAEEILEAYRELARKYHPDLNPSDPDAEKRFQQVQAAFEVLSNPERRAAYDRTELSFATARRSASDSGDGDDMQVVVRTFAAIRRQSRRRPSRFVWQGSLYVSSMIDATISWLIVILVGIALLAAARAGRMASEESAFYQQAMCLALFGKSLCVGGTLVHGIAMLMLLREHFSQ
jgi:curved DNA-binding protein CbpA